MPASARAPLLRSKLVLALSALLVGSITGPALGRALRPWLRGVVKGGIRFQRGLIGVVASVREDIEDIVAEANAELGENEGEAHPHTHGVPEHAHGSA